MTLVVAFASKTPISTSGSPPVSAVWTYRIESPGPGELQMGHRVAMVFPASIDIRDPALNPEIPALSGMFLRHVAASNRQYVGRRITTPGPQTLSFVAPDRVGQCELLLVTGSSEQTWEPVAFATAAGGPADLTQLVTAPAATLQGAPPPVYTGRPAADFAGALPYASELFGVYQPLAGGWIGMRNTLRRAARLSVGDDARTPDAFRGADARSLGYAAFGAAAELPPVRGLVSPIGLVNLFRQYFFEFDSFLGAPVGHLWVAAGGTVEVVETSTRRTLVERTAEQSEQVTRKSEESLTAQEDVVDAVKQENSNDTKLGVSASGGVNYGVYHGEATASLNSESAVKRSSEQTHKQTRTQSAKISSEITRNFKTTFKTVTETTDTTSRRYVVQNTTGHLINYELRRKMRKVGVQLQHIGTRLCWQVFLDDPGRDLGLGELVQSIAAPDLSSLQKPQPPEPLQPKETPFTGVFPIRKWPGTANPIPPNEDFPFRNPDGPEPNRISSHNNKDHAVADVDLSAAPPAPGYVLESVRLLSAKSGGADCKFVPEQPIKVLDGNTGTFKVMANFFNSGDANTIALSFTLTWKPPSVHPGQAAYDREHAEYDKRVGEILRAAYAEAIRQRLEQASSIRPRPAEDLRDEERKSVYGQLLHLLRIFPDDPATTKDDHLTAELIQEIFDVDEMLYFAAPDYWRPRGQDVHPGSGTLGRYPVPPSPPVPAEDMMAGQTVLSWYSHTGQHNEIGPDLSAQPRWRVNYLITEKTQPAPKGSSLGWLVQLDGDERRNEFLNAAWVKAVLPVRPGHEEAALRWLIGVEGETGLDTAYPVQPGDPPAYQGKTVGQVLELLTGTLQKTNTDMTSTLAAEKVFEHGFDPLEGGFRPAAAYEVFTQWVEVLPTDQIAAAEVRYDPATGQQF